MTKRGRVNTPANVKIIAKFVAAELALDTKKTLYVCIP